MTDTVTGVIEQVTKAWSSPDGVKTIFAVRIAGNDTVYKAWGDSGVDMSSMGNEMTLNVQEKDGRDGGKEHWLRSSSAKPFGGGGKSSWTPPAWKTEREKCPSFILSYAKDIVVASISAGHITDTKQFAPAVDMVAHQLATTLDSVAAQMEL